MNLLKFGVIMLIHTKPNSDCLPGFKEIQECIYLEKGNPTVNVSNIYGNEIIQIDNLISDKSCDFIVDVFKSYGEGVYVSVNGLKYEVNGIGSQRISGWSEHISRELSKLIIPYLGDLYCNNYTATDWFGTKDDIITNFHRNWKPIQISPLLRFMVYKNDSEHFSHFDAGYFYDDKIHRTLKSVVIYLTTNKIGSTRFIEDTQGNIKVWDRDFNDLNRRTNPEEILLESKPKKGKVLIFNHRVCHDVEQYIQSENEQERTIIRTDVIYKKI